MQLERVTQACLTSLSFQEKFDALQAQSNQQEEKIGNVGHLVKLLQSYSEAQEEDTQALKQAIRTVNIKVDDIAQSNVSGLMGGQINIQTGKSSRSPQRNRSPARSGSRLSRSPGQSTVGASNEQRIQKLESMVAKMNCAQHGFSRFEQADHHFSNSFGTLDAQRCVKSDDLNNLMQEVDK